jgi:hypothetical protein
MISILKSIFGKKKNPVHNRSQERPDSGSFTIKGKIKNKGKLKTEISNLSIFSQVSEEKKQITAKVIESTDRQKNPYLYIDFSFSDKGVEVYFSIPPEVPSPPMRKLEVMKSLFTLISLLEERGVFIPDREDLYSKVIEAFDTSSSCEQVDMQKMKYDLDRFIKDNSNQKTELSRLKEEKDGLNHQLLELEKKSQLLEDRVKQLEGLTDRELDTEIIRWVEDHSGKLDEEKFCHTFGLKGSRLDERLDSLSRSGVIRIV